MIRAMAYAGKHLSERTYLDAAERAARWLVNHHVDPMGELHRTSRDGQRRHRAFLDDYAYLCHALLALYDAGGHADWRDIASQWAAVMVHRFGDDVRGGFFFTEASAPDVIVRQKVSHDSPLPSGNAVAAMVLIQLDQMDRARRTIEAFAPQVEQQAEGMSAMVQAMMHYLQKGDSFHLQPAATATPKPPSPAQLAASVVDLHGAWISPRQLDLHVRIRAPYHLNAHDADAGLLATQVAVHGEAAADLSRIEYPPGTAQPVTFTDKPLRLYAGETIIQIHFNADQRGEGRVRVAIHYQACDDQACLPPVTKELEVNRP